MQQVAAQILWRTNLQLIDKLEDEESRIWYEQKAIENGWNNTILDLQIQSKLMERIGRTVNNFPKALPPVGSDMANYPLTSREQWIQWSSELRIQRIQK